MRFGAKYTEQLILFFASFVFWLPLFKSGIPFNSDLPAHYYFAWELKEFLFNFRVYDPYILNGFPVWFILYACFGRIIAALLSFVLPLELAFKIMLFSGFALIPFSIYSLANYLKIKNKLFISLLAIPFTNINYFLYSGTWARSSYLIAFMIFFIRFFAEFLEKGDKKNLGLSIFCAIAGCLETFSFILYFTGTALILSLLNKKIKSGIKFTALFLLCGAVFFASQIKNFEYMGVDFNTSYLSALRSISPFAFISLLGIWQKNKALKNISICMLIAPLFFVFSADMLKKFVDFPWGFTSCFIGLFSLMTFKKYNKITVYSILFIFAIFYMSNLIKIRNEYFTDNDFPEIKSAFFSMIDYLNTQDFNERVYLHNIGMLGYNLLGNIHDYGREYLSYTHYLAVFPIFTQKPTAGSFPPHFFPKPIVIDGKYMVSETFLEHSPWFMTDGTCGITTTYIHLVNARYIITPYYPNCEGYTSIMVFKIQKPEMFFSLFEDNFYSIYISPPVNASEKYIYPANLSDEIIDFKNMNFKKLIETDDEINVTLKMNYFPGFKAKIDGKEAETFKCWFGDIFPFVCVEVPEGRHEVEFYFESINYETLIYWMISIAGVFIFLKK